VKPLEPREVPSAQSELLYTTASTLFCVAIAQQKRCHHHCKREQRRHLSNDDDTDSEAERLSKVR
jgi:hypothetical protein